MIKVKTKYPVAKDSNDHLYPEGIYLDNNVDSRFVFNIEDYFLDKKINYLDLGCAGGALVCDLHQRGHTAVGIDGSSHCIELDEAIIKKIGRRPLGNTNWEKYYNEILFTADITKPFTITNDDSPMIFDMISAWDVLEHLDEGEVNEACKNILNHLSPNGIFIASIALFHSGTSLFKDLLPSDFSYHKTVKSTEWWESLLNKHFKQIPYPFQYCNRSMIPAAGDESYCVYAGKLK